MSSPVPRAALADGRTIDRVGYGVYKVPPEDTARLCSTALDAGYRLLDTASLYGNESGVGAAVRDYLGSGDRDELFITSKVWNDDHGFDATLRAFDASMDLLGLDRLDLYLIHWPCPSKDLYVETWRALERLQGDGRVRFDNSEADVLQAAIAALEQVPDDPGYAAIGRAPPADGT